MAAYQETKVHGTHGFPYIVYPVRLPERMIDFPHHWHEEAEIIYVTDGKLLVSVLNSEYIIENGDIVLIHPQTIHAIRQYEDCSARYYNILFRFSMLESGAEDTCREKYFEPIYSRKLLMPEHITREHPLHAEIEPIIQSLLIRPHHQRFNDELMIKSRLFELMYRVFPYCEPADKESAYEDIVYNKLKLSLSYLEEHFADDITIGMMAAVSNYSESHFSKLFKQLTGDSFTQYLKNYRLETAAERIRNEKTKISEIAMSCGFSNLSYFSRSFLAKFKVSPSEYRRSAPFLRERKHS